MDLGMVQGFYAGTVSSLRTSSVMASCASCMDSQLWFRVLYCSMYVVECSCMLLTRSLN